jgi:hypothetical protein
MEYSSFPINSKYKKKSNLILISENILKIILDFLNNLEWNRFFYFEIIYKHTFKKNNELFLLIQIKNLNINFLY